MGRNHDAPAVQDEQIYRASLNEQTARTYTKPLKCLHCGRPVQPESGTRGDNLCGCGIPKCQRVDDLVDEMARTIRHLRTVVLAQSADLTDTRRRLTQAEQARDAANQTMHRERRILRSIQDHLQQNTGPATVPLQISHDHAAAG